MKNESRELNNLVSFDVFEKIFKSEQKKTKKTEVALDIVKENKSELKSVISKSNYNTKTGKITKEKSYKCLLDYKEWYVILDDENIPCVFLKNYFEKNK